MSSEISLSQTVRRFVNRPQRMLIGGEWVESLTGETLESVDPATGRRLTTIARGDGADVDRAVRAARAAFESPAWRDISPLDRGRLLNTLAELIEEHADELALIEAHDNGKPVNVARAVDVGSSAKLFRYFAGWPSKFEGSTVPVSPRGGLKILNYTLHEPVGVVGAIVPWNFPMSMACWKLAPALATGNTVVLKPAEETSLSTLRLAELIQEAGFPDGVVNVVTGTGAEAGAAIADHAGVDKIAFTGSTEVGRLVARAATGNLKKVSLELGGKSPHIVLPDADPAQVAEAAADAIFFNQGQTCTAGSRLYVHKRIYDEVMAALVERAGRIVVGPGTDPGTEMGPLVSARHLARVGEYIASGRQEGGKLATGGGRPDGLGEDHRDGFFLQPTIFVETDHSMRVVREEIFGPVLVAMEWDDIDDLVAKANDTPYGLSAGVWTQDLKTAHRIAAAIRAGTVWVNCYNLTDPGSPFGGYKQSGWGREMGREVLEHYTETKSVWVNLT
ncbi:aldehyde dehydrogenase family protein [Nonomuraea basaltis]|uniref:aldehyde dehydrogenase family protein n=1 Tax=Nonomuraea basaltis TaxID=2495887 RepID=UPI00110C49E6|nr:aldehyde dehydrogenase family protein [Nonomuraea basaltis]TMR97814.1 aldehyde dehydrogenase family protein [Nonomuraea basaltis]